MNTNITTHQTSQQTTVHQAGPWLRVRATLLAAVTTLIAFAAVVGLTAPANAYSNTAWSGRQGRFAWGYTGGAEVGGAGFSVTSPQMLIQPNGALALGYQQEVKVRLDLQRWNGRSWTLVDQILLEHETGIHGEVANIAPATLQSSIRSAGYFRVAITIIWGYEQSFYDTPGISGTQQFVPSAYADMRCAVAGCLNYGSYLWLDR